MRNLLVTGGKGPADCFYAALKMTAKRKNPSYRAWQQMIARCECASSTRIERYISRGITVCPRWRASFEAFLEDMGPRPSPEHSLDRFPNNDGNYEPGNCRWATRIQQGNNKRNNGRYEFRGQNLTIREMLDLTGSNLKHTTVWARLNVYGWSASRALESSLGAHKWK